MNNLNLKKGSLKKFFNQSRTSPDCYFNYLLDRIPQTNEDVNPLSIP